MRPQNRPLNLVNGGGGGDGLREPVSQSREGKMTIEFLFKRKFS